VTAIEFKDMPMTQPFANLSKRVFIKKSLGGIFLASTTFDSLYSQTAANNCFGMGVASGEPNPRGLTIWTRLNLTQEQRENAKEIKVRWELSSDEGFKKVVQQGDASAHPDWGYSVHLDLVGLEPSSHYWYRFHALGQSSPTGKTRTTPDIHSQEPLHFVIASCQRFDQGHFAAWRHIAAEKPDLILFLGDYIYEYAPIEGRIRMHEGPRVRTLEQYRARYALYKSDLSLQAAHAAAPWMSIWDDHEVDDDYAALQGADLQPDFQQQRNAAYQAHWENMPLPMSMRPQMRNGNMEIKIHRRSTWGNLASLHFLDDRQYRSEQACPRTGKGGSNVVKKADCPALDDPSRSLLGRTQEEWLFTGWDSQRPWNLLAQQTLMAPLSWSNPLDKEGGTFWTDGWDGYSATRTRLLNSIQHQEIKGLVTLGGDVHAHFVCDLSLKSSNNNPEVLATEFCGSSISSFGFDNANVQRAKSFNPHIKYARSDQRGYISFQLSHKTLIAKIMALKDVNDPHSAIDVASTYAVQAQRPGANQI
jgi:alkaline phosphatase D